MSTLYCSLFLLGVIRQFHRNHTILTIFCATCCVDSFGPSICEISFDHSTNSSILSLDIIINKIFIFPTVSYSHNLWMTHHEFKSIAKTNLLSIDHSTRLLESVGHCVHFLYSVLQWNSPSHSHSLILLENVMHSRTTRDFVRKL